MFGRPFLVRPFTQWKPNPRSKLRSWPPDVKCRMCSGGGGSSSGRLRRPAGGVIPLIRRPLARGSLWGWSRRIGPFSLHGNDKGARPLPAGPECVHGGPGHGRGPARGRESHAHLAARCPRCACDSGAASGWGSEAYAKTAESHAHMRTRGISLVQGQRTWCSTPAGPAGRGRTLTTISLRTGELLHWLHQAAGVEH